MQTIDFILFDHPNDAKRYASHTHTRNSYLIKQNNNFGVLFGFNNNRNMKKSASLSMRTHENLVLCRELDLFAHIHTRARLCVIDRIWMRF